MIMAILGDVVVQVFLTSVNGLRLLRLLLHGPQRHLSLKGGVDGLGQTHLQLLYKPIGAPFNDWALDQGRQ